MTNPYSPPESAIPALRSPVDLALSTLSFCSFAFGFVAFMAYYGYPAFMNPTWYFRVLPVLALFACILGLAALACPWKPSARTRWSLALVVVCVAFPLGCFVLATALNATTRHGVFSLVPRIGVFAAASAATWILSRQIHGDSRGRRLASLGYGLGVLQCMTSIVDFFYTDWAM